MPFSLPALARHLANYVIPENSKGFTFDPRQGSHRSFSPDEFVVAIKGYERGFLRLPNATEVLSWLEWTAPILSLPGNHIGAWQNGLFYLDVSVVVKGLAKAVQVAYQNGQMGIYDAATNQTLLLPRREAA